MLLLGLIPFTGFAAFLALYGPEIGIDDVGPVFALYAGLVLLIRITAARLPDRLGWRIASTGALLSVGTGAALIGLWSSSIAVYISTVFMAMGMSLLFPALFSAVMNDTPESERSQAVGTFSLFFDLSQGLGAPLLGLVVALSGSYQARLPHLDASPPSAASPPCAPSTSEPHPSTSTTPRPRIPDWTLGAR